MPTYVILSELTDQGRTTIKNKPERIKEVNEEIEEKGAKIIDQYALFGEYDFITVVEAPTKEKILKIVMEMGSRGTIDTTTLSAMTIDDFVDGLKE